MNAEEPSGRAEEREVPENASAFTVGLGLATQSVAARYPVQNWMVKARACRRNSAPGGV
ncbi:hypothetical protein [Streptomyces zagrosensis]|uniref:Uncharacterized protein n=1 Tax=Streptomyces zagrosensis TaxID=1042984 RepID=A0A7W9V123_9ACTN|nr:hypothetical protein [Streptomyces zagrosensis]MBB5938745.1 hypothetical protein [Streptomyces zagrosensis]